MIEQHDGPGMPWRAVTSNPMTRAEAATMNRLLGFICYRYRDDADYYDDCEMWAPGYAWQDDRTVPPGTPMCVSYHMGTNLYCTLQADHHGLHEGNCGEEQPAAAWDDKWSVWFRDGEWVLSTITFTREEESA